MLQSYNITIILYVILYNILTWDTHYIILRTYIAEHISKLKDKCYNLKFYS